MWLLNLQAQGRDIKAYYTQEAKKQFPGLISDELIKSLESSAGVLGDFLWGLSENGRTYCNSDFKSVFCLNGWKNGLAGIIISKLSTAQKHCFWATFWAGEIELTSHNEIGGHA